MSELSKINRKIKSGMKIFIKCEDEGALKSVIRLSKKRETLLKNLSKDILDE